MNTLKKLIAVFCAILFVLSAILALLAFNIEIKAFQSATYKRAFESQRLYAHLSQVTAEALQASIAGNISDHPFLKSLTAQDWQAVIAALLPPDEIKALTDSALDTVFDYLNGNADSAVLSLLPIKGHLAGPSGVEAIQQILRAQPACTADQLLQIGLGAPGGGITLCNPPEELMGLLTPFLESQLQEMAARFPDQITLISGAQNNTPNDPRVTLNWARTLMKITPVFPLILLFILTLLQGQTLLGWLKWWGYPFLISGGISSAAAYFGAPVFGFAAQRLFETQAPQFAPPMLSSIASEALGAAIHEILRPVLFEGLILASLGLVMIIAGFLVARNARR